MPIMREEGIIEQFVRDSQHFLAALSVEINEKNLSGYSRCRSKPGTFVRQLCLQAVFCVVKENFSFLRW
jgi:hypothetical protein